MGFLYFFILFSIFRLRIKDREDFDRINRIYKQVAS